jgi:peptidoglycan/LPS O-acetylase OafA/YrhL
VQRKIFKTVRKVTMVSLFRPEIAGLRALAVACVVLFHLKVSGFHGGFVGVDVFFVISGYLISRNILRDLYSDHFSLAQFYIRRTRRIYPALVACVVLTYIAGALWCSPLMFLDIAKECTHALLSISNIQYWRESHKYFAAKSDELALLHCWSLSVEEQFYLIWPILLGYFHRLGRVREAIWIVTSISFLAVIVFACTDPSAVFFLMPFRIFEFGCGALLLFIEEAPCTKAIREALSVVGLAVIIFSAVLMRSDLPNLGLISLLPCLGAALVIFAGNETLASRLITNPFALAIGAISYSLYLCHWPIIFFARFVFGPKTETLQGTVVLLFVMIAVAYFLYRFVERRFVQPIEVPPISFLKYSASFWSIVLPFVALTHATFILKGFAWRLPSEQTQLTHLLDFPSGADVEPVAGPFAIQLVGDSHAVQYFAGLSPIMKRLGIKIDAVAFPGCPILYGMHLKISLRDYARCLKDQEVARAKLDATNFPIIFVQRWDYYDDATIDLDSGDEIEVHSQIQSYAKLEKALERTMGKFVDQGRNILIIGRQVEASCSINLPRLLEGPLPHAPLPPCPPTNREDVERSGIEINQMLGRIQAKWPDQIELVRPVDYFCDTRCPTVQDGVWLYRDRNHFTVAGSDYMVDRAKGPITEFLARTLTLANNNNSASGRPATKANGSRNLP